jgi:tetratricopeptide (TPR) repeat protein
VYDAVPDPRALVGLIPAGNADVIITSQFRDWQNVAAEIQTDTIDLQAAEDFLVKRSGIDDRPGARALAEALGRLPLAMEHAGAFLRRTPGLTFRAYQSSLEDRLSEIPQGSDYERSVTATFGLAIEKVVAAYPHAETLIAFLSVMSPEAIPVELLTSCAAFAKTLESSIRTLFEYSLLSFRDIGTRSETISVHRLVQRAMRGRLSSLQIDRAISQAARVLGEYSLSVSSPRIEEWRYYHLLSIHGTALVDAYRDNLRRVVPRFWMWLLFNYGRNNLGRLTPLYLSQVLLSIATFYRHRLAIGRAIVSARASLTFARAVFLGPRSLLGSESKGVLHFIECELSINLLTCGQNAEATPLVKAIVKSWAKKKRYWSNGAFALYTLALCEANSNATLAEELAQFCNDAGVKCFTKEPREYLISQYWSQALSRCQATMGDLGGAEKGFNLLLSAYKNAKIDDNTDFSSINRDLGRVLLDANRNKEAEKYLRVALEIDERALGERHPKVAMDRYHLALSLTGRDDEAENREQANGLLKRACDDLLANDLAGDDGKSPSELGAILAMLTLNYFSAERYNEAISEGEKAIAITRRVNIGEGLTRSVATILALAYEKLERIDDAERIRSLYNLESLSVEVSYGDQMARR